MIKCSTLHYSRSILLKPGGLSKCCGNVVRIFIGLQSMLLWCKCWICWFRACPLANKNLQKYLECFCDHVHILSVGIEAELIEIREVRCFKGFKYLLLGMGLVPHRYKTFWIGRKIRINVLVMSEKDLANLVEIW